jgi:hypothetical protein
MWKVEAKREKKNTAYLWEESDGRSSLLNDIVKMWYVRDRCKLRKKKKILKIWLLTNNNGKYL